MSDIIYYTDNQLDPYLFKRCQEYLVQAAEGKRIISVSQKPLDFGDNICLEGIGRSHHSLFLQALTGAKAATAKYIALAEHDCLYTPEHFNWTPSTDDLFYYNVNHWFGQWGGKLTGMYSYHRRRVLSNLICNRELFIEAIEEKLKMLEYGAEIKQGIAGACEPGVCDNREAFINLKQEIYKDVGKDAKNYRAKAFRTELPNIDIRHGQNFSGGRRARERCYTLPYWGELAKVLAPPGKWYQEATIHGVDMPRRRQNDSNEKRWETFIQPLIKREGGTVTDLGCNAGFYCRKFTDLGFKATGVERNPEFLNHARFWEAQDQKGIRIVDQDINDHPLTCSHVVLLANVHYWITPENLKKLELKLREKALDVILIGRYRPHPQHNSPCDLEFLKELFSEWELVQTIQPESKHFSVLFRNKFLTEKKVDDIFRYQQLYKSKKFLPSYNNLIDLELAGTEYDPMQTDYMAYLKWRRFHNGRILFERHVNLVHSMKDEGIIEPLVIGRMIDGKYHENRLVDGDHRLIVAKKLGMKSLICKIGEPK